MSGRVIHNPACTEGGSLFEISDFRIIVLFLNEQTPLISRANRTVDVFAYANNKTNRFSYEVAHCDSNTSFNTF